MARVQRDFRGAYEAKDWARAIELGERLAALAPDHGGHAYNLACVYALGAQPGRSVFWLQEAGARGFKNLKLLASDSDLASVRALPGYERVVALVKLSVLLP